MKYFIFFFGMLIINAWSENKTGPARAQEIVAPSAVSKVSLAVLGTIQDAGSPQIGCTKKCCKGLFEHPDKNRKVVSLGLIDHENDKSYLFEATPDFVAQTRMLKNLCSPSHSEMPDGIFITHAHIGHYTGLMYLGKESLNTNRIPVYGMPRMNRFLLENGPWSQLANNKNIVPEELTDRRQIKLTGNLSVIPFLVPHRDEFSETVGYEISGPNKKLLFIPDIDKWEKWDTKIEEAIAKADYAFVDATFYDEEEINNRDISTIPHPFIIETMKRFQDLPLTEKNKIYFIHFNHTNPVINKNSEARRKITANGFRVAEMNMIFQL